LQGHNGPHKIHPVQVARYCIAICAAFVEGIDAVHTSSGKECPPVGLVYTRPKQGWCHTAEPLGTWNLESTTSYRRAGARDSLAGAPLLSTAMHRKTRQISPLAKCRGRRAGPPLVPSRRDPHLTHSITSLSTRMRSTHFDTLEELGETEPLYFSTEHRACSHDEHTRGYER
jgi:hypothetical protein